jgi:hypothetical protein
MTFKLKIPPVLYLLQVLYIIIILIFAGRDLIGDEAGYAYYADNII